MSYTDKLTPEEQIDAEEDIAALIFEAGLESAHLEQVLGEEDCAELGRQILHQVLSRFRPDLVVQETP